LKERADLVIYAAEHLMHEEQGEVRSGVVVTHGVELDAFVAAGEGGVTTPDDILELEADWLLKNPGQPRPKRVGFIGGLDAHTFDPELFLEVAAELDDFQFVLVGGSSLGEDWCTLPNVALLGRKPYEDIAAYIAVMDVLIMPWNKSDWIKACNPIKLKEYLAVGRPVVTRDFPALSAWRKFVSIADDAPGFAKAIRKAVLEPYDFVAGRKALAFESWDAKASLICEALLKCSEKSTKPCEDHSFHDAA